MLIYRRSRFIILVLLAAALFSACSKIPEHARYIPKDAVAVAGINLKALGKKIAWNMITGSKLFQEMQKRIPEKSTKDAMNSIENAGIDLANTLYVYVKPDTRFKGGNLITGLVPLSSENMWEAYVRKVFPQAEIKQHGDHKEASLGRDMFVGWNSKLLVIINVMSVPADYNVLDRNSTQQFDKPMEDLASLSAEMDNAFAIAKDNSIITNKHFIGLGSEGHDITFWLNYGQLMDQYGSNMSGSGVSLSGALWKDAAFTAGIDFKKGKISGDMHYYLPDDMKEIGTELSAANIDKDMLDRLPNQNMDMLFAMHLSPKGFKLMLGKMGMLGFANTALAPQNMNIDNVLDAFTGDMSIMMNDFSLHTETERDSFMGQVVVHQNQKTTASINYAMKINKKENLQKLVDLAKESGLRQSGNGFIIPIDDKDSVYAMINDQYVVVSNKYPYAAGFLQGTYKSQKMPGPAAAAVTGHPFALFIDVQQLFKNIDAGISHSAQDSIMINESKKLLSNISLNGGEFVNNAFSYHLDINFTNTDENSLLELMDYGMKINDAEKVAMH